jgi:hypothetical protein
MILRWSWDYDEESMFLSMLARFESWRDIVEHPRRSSVPLQVSLEQAPDFDPDPTKWPGWSLGGDEGPDFYLHPMNGTMLDLSLRRTGTGVPPTRKLYRVARDGRLTLLVQYNVQDAVPSACEAQVCQLGLGPEAAVQLVKLFAGAPVMEIPCIARARRD